MWHYVVSDRQDITGKYHPYYHTKDLSDKYHHYYHTKDFTDTYHQIPQYYHT